MQKPAKSQQKTATSQSSKQAKNRTQPMKPHQPAPCVKPAKQPTKKSLKERFGNSLAIILATDTSTTPLVVNFEDKEKKPVTCVALDEKGAPIPTPRALQKYEEKEALRYAIELALDCCLKHILVLVDGPDSYQKDVNAIVDDINTKKKQWKKFLDKVIMNTE